MMSHGINGTPNMSILSSTAQWIKIGNASLLGAVDDFGLYFLDSIIDNLLGFVCAKFEADILRFGKVFMFTMKGV